MIRYIGHIIFSAVVAGIIAFVISFITDDPLWPKIMFVVVFFYVRHELKYHGGFT